MKLRKGKDGYPRYFDNKEDKEYDIRQALKSISRISPKIHRIRLSVNCTYEVLTKALGAMSPPDKTYGRSGSRQEMSDYQKKSYINFEGKVISVFHDPIKRYKPNYILGLSSSKYEYLDKIGKAFLPYIFESDEQFELVNIFSIEYAVDFFCHQPKEKNVANLFYIFRRYFFAPDCKDVAMVGGKFYGVDDEPRDENAVYKIFYDTNWKYIKIYERGPDSKKKKKGNGWKYKHVDRIRVEFTFSNPYMKKAGIHSFHALLSDAKFHNIFFPIESTTRQHLLNIKRFNGGSSKLPSMYCDYITEDDDGHMECFQLEHFAGEKKVENISQYVIKAHEFTSFLSKVEEKILNFDKRWKKEAKTINRNR